MWADYAGRHDNREDGSDDSETLSTRRGWSNRCFRVGRTGSCTKGTPKIGEPPRKPPAKLPPHIATLWWEPLLTFNQSETNFSVSDPRSALILKGRQRPLKRTKQPITVRPRDAPAAILVVEDLLRRPDPINAALGPKSGVNLRIRFPRLRDQSGRELDRVKRWPSEPRTEP